MLFPLVVLLLAADREPLTIATTDLSRVGGVSVETSTFVSEHFAQRLGEASGATVTTSKSMAAIIGIERQRELLGCADASATCLAELAGAIGAHAIAVGELAQLEHSLQLNLRIVDGKTAKTIFSATARGATTEELIDRIDVIARDAARTLEVAFPSPGAPQSETRWAPRIVTIAGAVVAAVGAGFAIGAVSERGRLGSPRADLSPGDAAGVGSRAATFGTVSIAMMVTGAVIAAAGIAWSVLGGRGQITTTVAPSGAGVFFQVSLP